MAAATYELGYLAQTPVMTVTVKQWRALWLLTSAFLLSVYCTSYEKQVDFNHWASASRLPNSFLPRSRYTHSKCLAQRQAASISNDGILLCSRCKRLLPTSAFSLNRARSNGLRSSCKECQNEYERLRRQRLREANMNRSHPEDARFYCPGCQQSLPPSEFGKSPTRANGLHGRCRACDRESSKLRRAKYKEANDACQLHVVFPSPDAAELAQALSLKGTKARNSALSAWGMYFCPSCQDAKAYDQFSADSSRKYGVKSSCKQCTAQRLRNRKVQHPRRRIPSRTSSLYCSCFPVKPLSKILQNEAHGFKNCLFHFWRGG